MTGPPASPEEVLGVERLPLMLTAGQVAKLLQVAPPTVYRWMSTGVVPSVSLAGTKRVPSRWVLEILESPLEVDPG